MRAATKLSQLRHAVVLAQPKAAGELREISERAKLRTVVTRPVLRYALGPSKGYAVLYPCDAGLSKPTNARPPSNDTLGYNGEKVERFEATLALRSLLKSVQAREARLYVAPEASTHGTADDLTLLPGWGERTDWECLGRASADQLSVEELLRHAVCVLHAIDALECLRCEEESIEETLRRDRDDEACPEDMDPSEARRAAIWSDALREAALGADRYYAFVQQLSGTIAEPVDAVVVVDEGKLQQQQRRVQDERQKLAQQVARAQLTLAQNVFTAVMKESGFALGIDREGGGQLTVVSSTLRDQALKIATGQGGAGYFGNGVQLDQLLAGGTGELTLGELLSRLNSVGLAMQRAAMQAQPSSQSDFGASLEYLSAPRNSLMLRWRPEAKAAVRRTFDLLVSELRFSAGACGCVRTPTAYELIEGADDALCNQFAQTVAYVLSSARMASPGLVQYINVATSGAVGAQARVSLQTLVAAWRQYAMRHPAPQTRRTREAYFDTL